MLALVVPGRVLVWLALLLCGCGPAPVRGLIEAPQAVRTPLIAAAVALPPLEDARPERERGWYPSAAAELGEAIERRLAAAALRADDQAPRRLALRLLRMPDPRRAGHASVQIEARLRGADDTLLWQTTVEATAPPPADGAHREALAQAVAQATGELAERLGRLLAGAPPAAAGGAPAVFLVERVGRGRDLVETLYIETISGQVLRHEVAPLGDHARGRPGDWLLSRRTIEGLVLSGQGYEALIGALAPRYDLRQLDDAYHVHFFGLRAPPLP